MNNARGVWAACALVACGAARDVVPESHDVQVTTPALQARETYVHVARRAHGVVALAEARGVPGELAARAIDHLADQFEACAHDLAARGELATGAGRVVAYIDANGAVGRPLVRAAPGGAVMSNLILCVVAPLRLLEFPPGASAPRARGLAVEAAWGPDGIHTPAP